MPQSKEVDLHTAEDIRRESKPYYNPRLNPKNYLEGALSPNPATRLRQLLARPGIIVGHSTSVEI